MTYTNTHAPTSTYMYVYVCICAHTNANTKTQKLQRLCLINNVRMASQHKFTTKIWSHAITPSPTAFSMFNHRANVCEMMCMAVCVHVFWVFCMYQCWFVFTQKSFSQSTKSAFLSAINFCQFKQNKKDCSQRKLKFILQYTHTHIHTCSNVCAFVWRQIYLSVCINRLICKSFEAYDGQTQPHRI